MISRFFFYLSTGKENIGTATEGGSDTERPSEPPAIVIYIVDPFTFGPASDSLDNMRLTTLGLIRCFSQMLPNISETLKNNISLQVVSLESILEIGQSQNASRMPNQMRGLAFSVFSQARRYVLNLFLGNRHPRISFICEFGTFPWKRLVFIAILHSCEKPSIDGATVDTIHNSEVFDSLRCRTIFKYIFSTTNRNIR